jgi:hypothetical protein
MPPRLNLIAATAALATGIALAAPSAAASAVPAPATAARATAAPTEPAPAKPPPTEPAAAQIRSARWTPPVPGQPTRLFALGADPFVRGQHRGVDLDAAAGERVRSACRGRVAFAGPVAGAGTVSVRCGRWRVTYAPLDRIKVKAAERVGAGRALGRMADGEPLHLGVRRAGQRFGYVDPLPFLAAADRAPPPVVLARRPPTAPRVRPAPRPVRATPKLAPWPVWLGLALLLTGLAGAGTLRFPLRKTGGATCRASSTSRSSPTIPSSP